MAGKVCCFTGHRPQNLPFGFNEHSIRCVYLKSRMKKAIEKLINNENVTHFISGMALGVDTYAAETVLLLKRKYPHITLEAAIPCEDQPMRWNTESCERYYFILEQCDKQTLIQQEYTKDCMFKRNKYMIDSSDILIAVWDGSAGGTGNTVNYAASRNKRTIIIKP